MATALFVSMGAHVLVGGLISQAALERPASAGSPSRLRSAMTLSRPASAEPSVGNARAVPTSPTPHKPMHAAAAPKPVPPPLAAAPSANDAPASAPVLGSAFAGLFAPVMRTPFGNGGWGRSHAAPPAAPAPPSEPELQREQAAMALQMSVQDRLQALAMALRAGGQRLSCEIVVDADRRVGEIACTQTADQAAPWASLQGLLVAGSVGDSSHRLCFKLADQLSMGACPSATAP